ncbi:MAG TPA: thiamine/thiamine pyrophosphate ABC transporter, permease protein [Leucothrix sp.]|nr:thiamine/thiamine pyrophosphate ABC transporter, permease protein [Leucothrix sp.]
MKIKAAYIVVFLLMLFISAPLASLFFVSDLLGSQFFDNNHSFAFWQDDYLRQVVFFSLWQAGLSTFLSVGIGLIVARAFAHYGNFPFRSVILGLFGLPLVVPAVVAVLGVISVYGSQGWIPLGSKLYGLNGILLAHLFFNMPLAVRLLLPVWNNVPQQYWRIGSQFGMTNWQQWRHIEWPALRETLPGVSVLIFMLCLTSFAVVLTLGGGPKSTTLEVAIYQSLRFDFDPAQAVLLAILQLALSILIAIIAAWFSRLPDVEANLNIHNQATTQGNSLLSLLFILVAIIFVASPLTAMLIDAAKGPVHQVINDSKLWRAAAFSVLIGLSAASISIILGWILLSASAEKAYLGNKRMAQFFELSGSVVYVVPPLVIGTGLFILLSRLVNVFEWAILIVILINGIMGLPFVIRTLGAAMRQNTARYQRLCQSLDLTGWQRFKQIDFPLLRKPIGLSVALVTAMAMGDLGVIALFGTPETATLPLLLYQRLSAYQMPQAAVIAVFLLGSCLLIFWLLERGISGKGGEASGESSGEKCADH